MGLFKFKWLTSNDRKEILRKASEMSSMPLNVSHPVVSEALPEQAPYKKMYYSSGIVTVVFSDGTVLSKNDIDLDTFRFLKAMKTQEEIEQALTERRLELTPVVETKAERDLVSKNLDVIRKNSEFDVQGSQVYLKGVNLALPASVIASFIEVLEKIESILLFSLDSVGTTQKLVELRGQFEALKMFWLKLALNTLPQSREDLLVFVNNNDVRITCNGNLVLYRRIVSKDGADQRLVTFISQQYYNVKKSGLDPKEFAISRDGDDYKLVDLVKYDGEGEKPIVNLQVAYLELPTYETNTFTAWHDKNVDIKIGGIYKIPEDKINLNNTICAAGGLHAAAVDYNYSGFGDLPVVVLVNPSKAITVPTNETGKLRTTEMFIACVNDKPHGVHFDEGALGAFDEEYHDLSLSELEEAARTKSFEKLAVADTVPAVSLVDLNVIRNMLKTRVKAI